MSHHFLDLASLHLGLFTYTTITVPSFFPWCQTYYYCNKVGYAGNTEQGSKRNDVVVPLGRNDGEEETRSAVAVAMRRGLEERHRHGGVGERR